MSRTIVAAAAGVTAAVKSATVRMRVNIVRLIYNYITVCIYVQLVIHKMGFRMQYQSVTYGSVARKSKSYLMRVDPRVFEAAKEAAAAERRSVADLIEDLLKEDLTRRGFLKLERPVKKKRGRS